MRNLNPVVGGCRFGINLTGGFLKNITSSNAINMAGQGRGRKYCTIMQEEEKSKCEGERLKNVI